MAGLACYHRLMKLWYLLSPLYLLNVKGAIDFSFTSVTSNYMSYKQNMRIAGTSRDGKRYLDAEFDRNDLDGVCNV